MSSGAPAFSPFPLPATAGVDGLSAAVLIDLRQLKVSSRKPRAVRPLLVDGLPVGIEAIAGDSVEAERPGDRRRALRAAGHRGDDARVSDDGDDAVAQERRRLETRYADREVVEAPRREFLLRVARVELRDRLVPGTVEAGDQPIAPWRTGVRILLARHVALALEEPPHLVRCLGLERQRRPTRQLAVDPTAQGRVVPVDHFVHAVALIYETGLLGELDAARLPVRGRDAIRVGKGGVDVRDATPRLCVHVLDGQLPELELVLIGLACGGPVGIGSGVRTRVVAVGSTVGAVVGASVALGALDAVDAVADAVPLGVAAGAVHAASATSASVRAVDRRTAVIMRQAFGAL